MPTKDITTIELWTLNVKGVVDSMEKYPEQRHIHWFWENAILWPRVLQKWTYTEGQFTYTRFALYEPNTFTIYTNLAGCPNSASHHLYATCKTCGQEG